MGGITEEKLGRKQPNEELMLCGQKATPKFRPQLGQYLWVAKCFQSSLPLSLK